MLVDALVAGLPAVGKLRPNDVIVAVDGKPRAHAAPTCCGSCRRTSPARRSRSTSGAATKRGDRDDPHGGRSRGPEARRDRRLRRARPPSIKLPLDVKIDLGNVGGPSAGLAFALDVMEELGRDVDGGHKIAATGEIELDGTRRPLGGVKQKTIARSPIRHRCFPRAGWGQRGEARRHADGLRIVPVKSFQQALQSLATLDCG